MRVPKAKELSFKLHFYQFCPLISDYPNMSVLNSYNNIYCIVLRLFITSYLWFLNSIWEAGGAAEAPLNSNGNWTFTLHRCFQSPLTVDCKISLETGYRLLTVLKADEIFSRNDRQKTRESKRLCHMDVNLKWRLSYFKERMGVPPCTPRWENNRKTLCLPHCLSFVWKLRPLRCCFKAMKLMIFLMLKITKSLDCITCL